MTFEKKNNSKLVIILQNHVLNIFSGLSLITTYIKNIYK